jgi:hypothetical protein
VLRNGRAVRGHWRVLSLMETGVQTFLRPGTSEEDQQELQAHQEVTCVRRTDSGSGVCGRCHNVSKLHEMLSHLMRGTLAVVAGSCVWPT